MNSSGACLAALALVAQPLGAEPSVLPSGLRATLHETVFEPVGAPADRAKTLRLRYVAPALSDTARYNFDVIEADFQKLCELEALPIVSKSASMTETIIISLAAAPIPFGESMPEIVQYFDAFRPVDGVCIWEGLF